MNKKQLCKDFLKDNDNLLFEFSVYGKSNKSNTLINWLASILFITSMDIIKHSYIIGVGKSNIYIVDLGIHIFTTKNIKPKKVHILDKGSISNIIIDTEHFDITHKITIQTQKFHEVFFTDCNKISPSQLNSLLLLKR